MRKVVAMKKLNDDDWKLIHESLTRHYWYYRDVSRERASYADQLERSRDGDRYGVRQQSVNCLAQAEKIEQLINKLGSVK
jgi:hypothetical protein